MCKYDNNTLEPIPPTLVPGEKEHVLLAQDKGTLLTNDHPRRMWLKTDQQPLKKKGNGWGIHIFNWICEPLRQLALSPEQFIEQAALPDSKSLMLTRSFILERTTMHGGTWIN